MNQEELERRRRRREAIRRKKRARKIRRIVTLIIAAAVIVLAVLLIVNWRMDGSLFKNNSSEQSAAAAASTESVTEEASSSSESAEEPIATTAPTAVPTEAAPTETPTPTPAASASNWTYVSSEQMPEGDIVPMTVQNYSYENMRRDLYFLCQRYPSLLTVNVIGYSADGREILDCVVGNQDAGRDILVQCSMHAREHIMTVLGMKQLETLLANYETGTVNDETYASIFSKTCLHLIPMINPDGVTIAQEGFDSINDETLRNNLYAVYENDQANGINTGNISDYTRIWKANANAVDLNRNFASEHWTADMGSLVPSAEKYPGATPNSEPEVVALLDLTEKLNVKCQIAYHVHGHRVYWDYGMQETEPELYETDHQLANLISACTAVTGDGGYDVMSTVEDNQNAGGASDYYMQILKIPAVTVECGDNYLADGSYNDAPLPIDQIDNIFAENYSVLPSVAQMFENS